MMEEYLINCLNSWDHKEELVWGKKIILGEREIEPLNIISILYDKSGDVAFTSIKPLAWFITEKEDEYILLLDEEEYDKYFE
ncbi:hypothetical protein [Methanobacterium alcaliphilum]|uniref:hypothetical protein n=1 Tax=Methanobacterium alcaliphilum TaxID=392018 RepID=UPI00200A2180|nr:hypothetical protein [Methanobacterium alcaliphilum]MCK9151509.1 hypothetical protein [Methanobacterium alcaliphilum]